MDPPQALTYLNLACVPAAGQSDADLLKLHQDAVTKLGKPIPNAGHPEILDIPADCAPHVNQLLGMPWAASIFASLPGWSIKLVEIEPLLTLQFHVLVERSEKHCSPLQSSSVLDLMPVCLPTAEPHVDVAMTPIMRGTQSVMIKTRELATTQIDAGVFPLQANGAQIQFVGMLFRYGSPFVYVARYNGRCFLANGYHRASGLSRAGATHMPCIFRDATTPEEMGVKTDGSTLSIQRLEADNPPAVGHFTQGRALEVQLRMASRIFHASWSEYTMADE